MNQAIYNELVRVAQAQTTITYSEIAPLANLDMSLDPDRVQMSVILEEISRYENGQGRPLLTAVVVHGEDREASGTPGRGFYTLADSLGLRAGQDRVTFFARELIRVHEEWAE